MKTFLSLIYPMAIWLFVSCQQNVPTTDNILVGHWYVSELNSTKKILIETPQTKTESSTDHFVFTNETVCHYITEDSKIIKSDTSAYTLSNDNKTLLLYYAENKIDTVHLNYTNKDEFKIEDNMGLILTIKRKK